MRVVSFGIACGSEIVDSCNFASLETATEILIIGKVFKSLYTNMVNPTI